ncbi:MAG: amidohydrolase family protein [Candidatus Aminicenantes bacterium]|nr:amidohydrolase family protein [Candidatus Aminicenantes bacterium]
MRKRTERAFLFSILFLVGLAVLGQALLTAQTAASGTAPAPEHAKPVKRLLIRNAMIIYGNAEPPFGPANVCIEDGRIARVGGVPREWQADAEIDATGKYVMPGIVNGHMHLQDERGGVPQPFQYEMNLYLAAGATTIRDVGADWKKAQEWRAQSAAHTLVAPRILLYERIWASKGSHTAELVREGVRFAKAQGVDGLKLSGMDRDLAEALMDEARKQGLRTAVHNAVDETTARDWAELGVTSIEHFYGVADAALDGIQNFPPEHNSSNEIHRFGRAGELYIQPNLNREKLSAVLELMVKNHVFWCPTLSIYVASRDVIRAQNQPWFKDYLHPTLEQYFQPDMRHHGSYFLGWTNTQEVRWKKDYQVWMEALKEFDLKGGLITVGDDAGFIYSIYGFGQVHELELLEEAGFHPLEVIKMATVNGARMLGLEDRLGRVRQGFIADLLVVNGNPVENLRLLNPAGTDVLTYDGRVVDNYSAIRPGDPKVKVARGGGIEWTIKEGIPYHVPTLMREVKDMVDQGRAERAKK